MTFRDRSFRDDLLAVVRGEGEPAHVILDALVQEREEYIKMYYNKETKTWDTSISEEATVERHMFVVRALKTKIRLVTYAQVAHHGAAEFEKYAPILSKVIDTLAEDESNLPDIFQFDEDSNIKHMTGNWDCQACLASALNGQEGAAVQKHIEWCPKFLPMFRSMKYSEVPKGICYAGLLHCEMEIQETEGKTTVVITKKCDSCGHTIVESKEVQTEQE